MLQAISLRFLSIAAIVSSVICGAFILSEVKNGNQVYFQLDIVSSANGVVQVFYDRGQEFREEESERKLLYSSEVPLTYRFHVLSGTIKKFRFDPNNASGTYVISRPKFVNGVGREIRAVTMSSFSTPAGISPGISTVLLNEDAVRLNVADGNSDPWIIVNLDPWLQSGLQTWRISDLNISSLFPAIPMLWIAIFALLVLLKIFAENVKEGVSSAALLAASSPRRAITIVAIISTLLSCYPVVFFGKSFVSPNNGGAGLLLPDVPFLPGATDLSIEDVRGSDVGAMMWEHRPYSNIQHNAIAQGEFPLWNRYNSAGTTLLGQGISMIGDPLHWITVLADGAAWAWDLKFLFAKAIFCSCAGLLIFTVTGSLGPALIVASSSAFIGFFVYRFNHPAFFSLCYAPMILLGWAGIIKARSIPGSRRYLLLLVLGMLMELNSGTAKEAYILTIFLNITGALVVILQRWSWREKAIHLTIMSSLGLATILILAPFWLVFQDELSRAFTLYNEPSAHTFPIGLFTGFLDEIFYAEAYQNRKVVGPALNLLIGGYLVWGLACLPRLAKEPWFLACAIGGAVSASIAFGLVPPAWIIKIPILKNVIHIGNTFSCVLLIQGLVVAGFGIYEFQKQARASLWRSDFAISCILVSILAVGYWWSIFPEIKWSRTLVVLMLGPTIGLGIFIFCFRQACSGDFSRFTISILVLCVVAIHFRLGQHLETGLTNLDQFVANPHERPDFFVRSAALDALPSLESSPYRVTGIDGVSFPGYQATLGLEGINGADALWVGNFRELVDVLGFNRLWGWLTLVNVGDLKRLSKGLDVLNVRYLLFSSGASIPSGEIVKERSDLTVVERPTVWPRAYFTDRLQSYHDLTELADLLSDSEGPIAAIQSGEGKSLPGEGIVVAATNYRITPNSITFSIDAPRRGVAVLGEVFIKDSFSATLNSQNADLLRINHAFKGVLIPAAGKYTLTFRYRPPLFLLSLGLSSLGGVILLGILFLPWYRRSSLPQQRALQNSMER